MTSIPSSDALKYAAGRGPRVESHGPRTLEVITCIHVAIFALVTAWWFGGQSAGARLGLGAWGSLSVLILLASLRDRYAWRERGMKVGWWLLPLGIFDVLVLIGAMNPGFRTGTLDGLTFLIPMQVPVWQPTSAKPPLTLEALWVFNTIWLSAFNVALIVRKRRSLRLLLGAMVLNATVLAVIGTAQKFTGAKGLFFDAVPSPQEKFFSTFVYHNHWGSFTVLMMAACLGLVWHFARRKTARDFLHSPAFSGVVIILLLAVTLPLSLSRSTTVVGLALLGLAFAHVMFRTIAVRRRYRESIAPPILALLAAAVVAGVGIWNFTHDSIATRVEKTREQIAEMRAAGGIGGRARLYQDTWRMGRDRPVFGWGMASYPHVFMIYNTTDSPADRLPVHFNDAHSDWLQSFAEHGAVGTTLLVLCAVLPLASLRRRHLRSPLVGYLLAGCGLIVLYATVEFPFGNFAVVLHWWLLFFCGVQYCRLIAREERRAEAQVHPPG